jgi:peptidoglycan/xylan/chitin deacetylase (PgdA/CDA1 family)
VTTVPAADAWVVWRGDPGRWRVALTFDAGSDVGYAEAILTTLAANGITATFGITGAFADDHPDVVGAIAAGGHQLVNHSDSHPSFTGYSTNTAPLPSEDRVEELWRAEAAITAAAGRGTNGWFRPPYGDYDDGVLADVATAGWPVVLMWTVDSLGWKGLAADVIVARCLDNAEPGAIFLFHVGSQSQDAAALQGVIDGLRAEGYEIVSAAALVT